MYLCQASWTSNEDTEMASTNIAETNKALSNSDENIQSRRDDMMLKQSYDSHQQRINVVNNVLLGKTYNIPLKFLYVICLVVK